MVNDHGDAYRGHRCNKIRCKTRKINRPLIYATERSVKQAATFEDRREDQKITQGRLRWPAFNGRDPDR